MKKILVLLFCLAVSTSALSQNIVAPATGTAGSTTLFKYPDATVYTNYYWLMSNPIGTVTSSVKNGANYEGTIQWTATGTTNVTFYIYGYPRDTVSITVSCPTTISAPTISYQYPNGTTACGSLTITYTGPPAVGMTRYWQSSATGTSKTNSSSSMTATASGTYYVRSNCGSVWGTALATSNVTVKPVPTVTASSPSVCSGSALNVDLVNNVPGTLNSWTTSSSNSSGAVTGSGTAGASAPYKYTLAQTLTTTTNASGSAIYTITPSANGCIGTAYPLTATVKPVPNASTVNQTIFSGTYTSIPIINPNGVSGTAFNWNFSGSNVYGTPSGSGSSIGQLLIATSASDGTGTYTITPTASSCSGTSVTSSVIVYKSPKVIASDVVIAKGVPVTLTTEAAYDSYVWKNAANTVLGTGSSVSVTQTGTYTVVVTKNGATSNPVSITIGSQFAGLDMNYIVSNSALVASTDPYALGNLSSTQSSQAVAFFDGLGQPIQNIITQGSPSQQDLIVPVVYDGFDREYRKYLPVAGERNGRYKSGLLDAGGNYSGIAFGFYNNGLNDKINDDTQPFAETLLESSPLNRAMKEIGPGSDWYVNNKVVRYRYTSNVSASAEKVIAWQIDNNGLPVRHAAVASYITAEGYYVANQVKIKVTLDEQGNNVREYTDKDNHIVLKRVQIAAGSSDSTNINHWASTYYVYNIYGNLAFAMQPELSKKNHQNNTYNPTVADLKALSFQYKYDLHNRMTHKRVPGAGWIYLVYDIRDRLALTQDSIQRAATPKRWTFTKYDELNRAVLTGIKDTAVLLTQADMQSVVDVFYSRIKTDKPWRRLGEVFVGASVAGNIHGYTNNSYPQVTAGATLDLNTYLSASYYDNYLFKSTWGGNYDYTNASLSQVVGAYTYLFPVSANQQVIGQVTGTEVKVLDGGITGGFTWLKSVNYFDDRYRVVQTVSDNYKSGSDKASILYDFTGKVLKTVSTHTESDVAWTDRLGVASSGNILKKTIAGSAWGVSGAASVQLLPASTDGWIEVPFTETTTNRMIGFSDSNIDAQYTSIDYALYLNTTAFKIYENGALKLTVSGTRVPGDVARVERTGTTIKYKLNGTVVYTSTIASSSSLMVDVAFAQQNATVAGVRTSFSITSHTTLHRFEYDHAGRLLRTWYTLDAGPEYLLALNEYNELGQLVDKKLHSTASNGSDAKQSIDYRYNIRGWLTSINNASLTADGNVTNDETGDYYGMNLSYNGDSGTGNTGQYNGNISAMTWSVNQGFGGKQMAYNFGYDAMNRLLGATHKQYASGSWSPGQFDENGLTYDQNGNIKSLQRKGDGGSVIDDLAYNYGAVPGNQLQYVQDNTANATDKAKGFLDGNVGTATDYTYDANGNMTRDLNKKIGNTLIDNVNIISYNFLNLPEMIVRDGNKIQYVYDASGRKLSQIVTFGTTQKQTDYVGEYVYENDQLQFISTEEGRIVLSGNTQVYSNTCDVAGTDMTPVNATLTPFTGTSGEKYIKVTSGSTAAKNGVFPIGGTVPVAGGERYRIRARGYRTTNPVYIDIKLNGVEVEWPGAALSANATAETWVEQTVTVPAGATSLQAGVVWNTTVANGEIFYLNDFEITKLSTKAPEYQYNLKDHLGNIRTTFTTVTDIDEVTATFETAAQATEATQFLRYDDTRLVNSTLFDHTNGPETTHYAERLNGSANEKTGLVKTLSVMPGDQIHLEVYGKYVNPESSNWTAALAILMNQIATGTAPPGVVVDGAGYPTNGGTPFPFAGLTGTDGSTGTGPKAYLNYIIFDRNFVLLDAGYVRMSAQAKETGTDVDHELLSKDITIAQAGYLYTYLSNDEATPMEVYFDDFNVKHTKSPVIQSEDYYPFGLTFNSYSRENSVANKYLYSGKELQTDLGLNLVDYGPRMYDATIGRFGAIDNYASHFARYSAYSYAVNNPILFKDQDGNYPVNIVNSNGVLTMSFMYLINTVLGISYNTLADTKISYNKDVWYSPHSFTGYESGGITMHDNIILTNDFDTRGGSLEQTRSDVEKWFGLVPHELGHRVQRDRSMFYLTRYGVQAIATALGKGSADESIVHDEIPMEAEAAQYQQKFTEFFNFFNYKDKKGNDRNKITDLFSGGRKDDDHIIDQIKQYKAEYDKAQEEESKKKADGLTSMVNNFSNLQQGTYTWKGSSWLRIIESE